MCKNYRHPLKFPIVVASSELDHLLHHSLSLPLVPLVLSHDSHMT